MSHVVTEEGVLRQQKVLTACTLAHLAVTVLIAEAELTLKPALVSLLASPIVLPQIYRRMVSACKSAIQRTSSVEGGREWKV